MKLLPIIALLLCGCAHTTFYSARTGKKVADFQGDMTGSHFAGYGIVWNVQQVSHSAATLAQGAAAANVIGSIGTAAAGVALAAGSSGLFPRALGAAAPMVTTLANRPTTHTPAPAVLSAH